MDILDSLSLQNEPELAKVFEGGTVKLVNPLESVFVSCKVKKYNKFDWKQDRTFAVTEKHIYNIKGKSTFYSEF